MNRNPLMDPVPGDRVTAENGTIRTVLEVRGGDIVYQPSTGNQPRKTCWISTWQEWCRKHKASAEGGFA